MSADFVSKFTEYINGSNLTPSEDLISQDVEFIAPHSKEPLKGLEGYTKTLLFIKSGFSDIQWTPKDICSEGNKITVLWDVEGTHDGEFMGIVATDKKVQFRSLCLYYVENRKLLKEFGFPDLLGLLNQLKE